MWSNTPRSHAVCPGGVSSADLTLTLVFLVVFLLDRIDRDLRWWPRPRPSRPGPCGMALWMRVIVGRAGGRRASTVAVATTFIGGRWIPDARRTDGRKRGGAEGRGEPDGRRAVLPTDAIMKTYFCRCRSLPLPAALERREAHSTLLCTPVIFISSF